MLWDAKSGDTLGIFAPKGHTVAIAISSDGKTLASIGPDKSVILWDVHTGNQIRTIKGFSDSVFHLSFSPDGTMLAATAGRALILLDLETGEISGKTSEYLHSITFSPEGKLWAMGSTAMEGDIDSRKAILWEVGFSDIRRKFKKDEFETTKEYEARVSGVEVPYSTVVSLRKEQYNADRGGFEIDFRGYRLFVPVEREKAKELAARKAGEVELAGKLKYYNLENLALAECGIVDSFTGERYAVQAEKKKSNDEKTKAE